MSKQIFTTKTRTLLVLLFCIRISAHAGGLWVYETGTPDAGLANAGLAARAQDASTAYNNPAGMSLLEQSEMIFGFQGLYGDLGFNPNGYTDTSGGSGGNAIGFMPGASFAYVHRLDEEWSFGISSFSNFGLGLDYDSDWAGRYYVQDATLIGMSVMPSLSYRIDEQWSVGVGLNAMYGILDMKMAINNVTDGLSDGRMKYDDTDWGFGGVAGVIFKLDEKTRFGLNYTSPVDLDFKDNPEFSNLGPAFNWILGRADIQKLDLGLTVPQTLMASVYHELNDQWALLGNVGWQDWSQFGRLDVSIDASADHDVTKDLDYKDTWSVGLGTQYKFAPKWMASTGISYDSAMLDEGDATPAMPVGDSWRWGLGFQHEYSAKTTISMTYELVYNGDIKVDQERGPLSGRVAGKYKDMMIHVFGASLIHRF